MGVVTVEFMHFSFHPCLVSPFEIWPRPTHQAHTPDKTSVRHQGVNGATASARHRLSSMCLCPYATMPVYDLIQIGRAQSELQSPVHLVCRLLLEKKKK